jgi:guanylate kinase
MNNRSKTIVTISGASGVGKTSLINLLLDQTKDGIRFERALSVTTRKPRAGSTTKDRTFITEKDFKAKLSSGELIEYAKVYKHYYGLERSELDHIIQSGSVPIFDLDIQGVKTFKKHPGGYNPISVFVRYDSTESIKKRLLQNPERRADLEERVQSIQDEEKVGSQIADVVVTNKQGEIQRVAQDIFHAIMKRII